MPCAPQVTRVDGDKVLPYRSEVVQILQLTLHLKCKQGYTLACNLLHHLLRSSALLYPKEYCSVPGGFHQPISDYLPIKVQQRRQQSCFCVSVYLCVFMAKSTRGDTYCSGNFWKSSTVCFARFLYFRLYVDRFLSCNLTVIKVYRCLVYRKIKFGSGSKQGPSKSG